MGVFEFENKPFNLVPEEFLKGIEIRVDSIRKQVEAGIQLVPCIDPDATSLKELCMACDALLDVSSDVHQMLADHAEAERRMLEHMDLQRQAELSQGGE